MHKFNFFSPHSVLHPFRWFIVLAVGVLALMIYADLTGWRLLSFSGGQQWSSNGPGYHK